MRTQIAYLIIAPAVPLLAAFGLRYLFAIALRESVAWFAHLVLQRESTRVIGARLAMRNGLILALAGFLFVACTSLKLPWPVIAATGVLGILGALVATIWIIRDSLKIDVPTAGLIGLVSFAGGNLPLILLVPAMLAFGTFA